VIWVLNQITNFDAEFLYDTIDKYAEDAQKANNQELVEIWNKIKADRLNHLNRLKVALEKGIHAA
jgi:hypothetical protein